MKKVKTEEAVGLTLCHDITEVRDGFKGRAFRRGHIVTAEDIPHLLDLGKKHLYIWEENAGEIHEEDAAQHSVASKLAVPGFYRIRTREENLDAVFVTAMAFARSRALNDEGGTFGKQLRAGFGKK